MWPIDLFIEIYSFLIGIPCQRYRARRLLRSGRGQIVLSYPTPRSALLTSRMSGVAVFSPGSIQIRSWRAHVTSVELPGRVGRDITRQDDRMIFGPRQMVYRIHTQRGSCDMTLLRLTADDLIARLGVATSSHGGPARDLS